MAPNARIMLEGFQVVLGLLTCKGQHVGTPGLLEPLPIADRRFDCGPWTLSLGYLYVQMVAMPFSPVLIV